uniref:cDNA FLJ50255 n=1 Tax=Homo sapiens TaxID=9606 RepID=B4DW03_HUMAN|nr:unnamed protein product [Homo sapiens]
MRISPGLLGSGECNLRIVYEIPFLVVQTCIPSSFAGGPASQGLKFWVCGQLCLFLGAVHKEFQFMVWASREGPECIALQSGSATIATMAGRRQSGPWGSCCMIWCVEIFLSSMTKRSSGARFSSGRGSLQNVSISLDGAWP